MNDGPSHILVGRFFFFKNIMKKYQDPVDKCACIGYNKSKG